MERERSELVRAVLALILWLLRTAWAWSPLLVVVGFGVWAWRALARIVEGGVPAHKLDIIGSAVLAGAASLGVWLSGGC